MQSFRIGALAMGVALVATLAAAAETPGIAVTGGARTSVDYRCSDGTRLAVTYVNAPPNALAILRLDGDEYIFANVIAASGARYASGPYVWWTKGRSASLYDERRGPNAQAVRTCDEETG